jgi:hypothetical protein
LPPGRNAARNPSVTPRRQAPVSREIHFLRQINGQRGRAGIVVRFRQEDSNALLQWPRGLTGGSAAAARFAARYPAAQAARGAMPASRPGRSAGLGDFGGHRPPARNNLRIEIRPGCIDVRLETGPATPQAAERA